VNDEIIRGIVVIQSSFLSTFNSKSTPNQKYNTYNPHRTTWTLYYSPC